MCRKTFPVCSQCDHVLNPYLEDDCESYYIVGGEIYCKYCFQEWLRDLIDSDPERVASALEIQCVAV